MTTTTPLNKRYRLRLAASAAAAVAVMGVALVFVGPDEGATVGAGPVPTEGRQPVRRPVTRQELEVQYRTPNANRRSVEHVTVKRVAWGEFAAAAALDSRFTVASGTFPSNDTEVYVVLVEGDLDPAPGYPEPPGNPVFRFHVAVIEAATGQWIYEHTDPGEAPPHFYDDLQDRPDPPRPT